MRCVDSLRADGIEVVVVQNGNRSPELVAVEAREAITVVDARGNVGFPAGCNRGAAATDAGVLVFVNPDAVAEPGAVLALVNALTDDAIGIAQARLRLLDEPGLLNSGGNVLHISGIAWPSGYRMPASSVDVRRDIAYASGAAFAIRANVFREIGGFNEDLFIYQEDLELSWRVWLRGLRVVVEPRADFLHDYTFDRTNKRKLYYLERNRLVFVLTAYSARLLLLLMPVFFVVEASVALVALREGWLREKARGWGWLLSHAGWLVQRRRAVQALRRVPDRELARLFTSVIDPPMTAVPAGTAVLNGIVSAWWRAVRVLL